MNQNRSGDIVPVKFNQPFPNACIGVVLTQSVVTEGSTANLAVNTYNKNGFSAAIYATERSAPVSWIAFGY